MEAALLYDAVMAVVDAVRQLERVAGLARPRAGARSVLRVTELSCDDLRASSHGPALYSYVTMASPRRCCCGFRISTPGPDLSEGKLGSCPGPPQLGGPPQNSKKLLPKET